MSLFHKGRADALPLEAGVNGQRSQSQKLFAAGFKVRKKDVPSQNPVHFCHKGQGGYKAPAFSQLIYQFLFVSVGVFGRGESPFYKQVYFSWSAGVSSLI